MSNLANVVSSCGSKGMKRRKQSNNWIRRWQRLAALMVQGPAVEVQRRPEERDGPCQLRAEGELPRRNALGGQNGRRRSGRNRLACLPRKGRYLSVVLLPRQDYISAADGYAVSACIPHSSLDWYNALQPDALPLCTSWTRRVLFPPKLTHARSLTTAIDSWHSQVDAQRGASHGPRRGRRNAELESRSGVLGTPRACRK